MAPTFEQLWAEYQQRRRPANIGDRVAAVRLGELDDDVAGAASSYAGMGDDIGGWRVAQLGLAFADLQRVLPEITPVAAREYFELVAELAKATLQAVAGQATTRA